MKRIILLFSIGLISVYSYSQDSLLLMTGKVVVCEIDTVTGEYIRYFNAKGKDKFEDPFKVFSIKYSNGLDTILYQRNLTLGNEMNVEDMRIYIQGSQLAFQKYNPYLPMAASFVAGFFGGVTGNFFYAPLPPVATIALFGSFTPKPKPEYFTDKSLLDNESYVYGYRSTAKNMKIRRMALSALGGIIVGYVTNSAGFTKWAL